MSDLTPDHPNLYQRFDAFMLRHADLISASVFVLLLGLGALNLYRHAWIGITLFDFVAAFMILALAVMRHRFQRRHREAIAWLNFLLSWDQIEITNWQKIEQGEEDSP